MSPLPYQCLKDDLLLSTNKTLLQVPKIHAFLSQQAYWSQGIPLEIVSEAIANSLCFGLYLRNDQIGFARIVTDSATFAWLCDVYVEPSVRGHGYSKWMIEGVLKHPALQGLRRICLATKDAHPLYKNFGFKVTETPLNWMEIKRNNSYK
jgi:GNAT superfamily N-acetyltransferase